MGTGLSIDFVLGVECGGSGSQTQAHVSTLLQLTQQCQWLECRHNTTHRGCIISNNYHSSMTMLWHLYTHYNLEFLSPSLTLGHQRSDVKDIFHYGYSSA